MKRLVNKTNVQLKIITPHPWMIYTAIMMNCKIIVSCSFLFIAAPSLLVALLPLKTGIMGETLETCSELATTL